MRLFVEEIGSGLPVVLLHGFPLDHSMWRGQTSRLKAGSRLITPDLRGHGQSNSPPDEAFEVDAMADDVIETLEVMGVEGRFVLGGLSMGGYVALSIAERFPGRLLGLMLLDTKSGCDTPEAAAGRLELATKVETTGDVGPVVESMMPRLFALTTRERRAGTVEATERVMRSTSPHTVAATLRGLATRPDRTTVLAHIRVPTVVIVGEHDAITPPSDARGMAELVPDARLVTIQDAGHLSPLESPEAVNRAILEFIERLPRA